MSDCFLKRFRLWSGARRWLRPHACPGPRLCVWVAPVTSGPVSAPRPGPGGGGGVPCRWWPSAVPAVPTIPGARAALSASARQWGPQPPGLDDSPEGPATTLLRYSSRTQSTNKRWGWRSGRVREWACRLPGSRPTMVTWATVTPAARGGSTRAAPSFYCRRQAPPGRCPRGV